ncbi:MAG: cupin domain-containing protein, partial [Thermomicrobiales bacterium]
MIVPISDADAAAMELPLYGPLKAPTGVPLDGEMFTSGKVFWRSDNGVIVTGIWECSAGRMRADFGNDGEMVHVVKGTLHAIPDVGEPFTVLT